MGLSTIRSTRGRSLDLSDYRGRAVVVFYEARDRVDDNAALKESCARLLSTPSTRGRLEVLGIADVQGLGRVRSVVTKAVQLVALRYGTELWLDFEGALQRPPYRFASRSTVAVFDPQGALAFRAAGRLDADALGAFLDALGASLGRAAAERVAADLRGARPAERAAAS